MFEAIIFDFDGVILDSEPMHYTACSLVFENIGFKLSYKEYLKHCTGVTDKELFPKLLENNGHHLSQDEIKTLIHQKITSYTNIIRENNHLPFIENVRPYILQMIAKGKKLAICSSSTKNEIIAALEKLQSDFKSHFNIIITSENVQYGKPSPEGYLLTANALNVTPNRCCVIEDSPHGITAAKSAEMYVVALTTTHQKHELQHADIILNNFSDLLALNLE